MLAQTVLPAENSKTGGKASSIPSPQAAFAAPHGVRVVQNGRPVLEDAFSHAVIDATPPAPAVGSTTDGAALCAAGLPQQQPLTFFGVYDGHGGAEFAHHAASKLHQHFQAAYKQLASQLASSGSAFSDSSGASLEDMLCDHWNSSSSSQSCNSNDSSPTSTLSAQSGPMAPAAADLTCSSPSSTSSGSPTCGQVWATINGSAAAALPQGSSMRQQQQQHPSRASRAVVQALREAFLRTDADLAGTEVGEVVGTTAVTAVLSQSELFIGHAGDSRAVLCRKGMALPLTEDHKPGRADEMARVSSMGGKIVYKAGSHRVMGLLAMSRALGDHFLRPYVIPEPEVLCLQRCPDDELLILATDGLWDVFSCQEATTLALRSIVRARQRGASASAACRVGASVLVRGAIERGSRDNITVAVVDLRSRKESSSVGITSVASVLASQCSSDLSAWVAGGGSRKRRSSSGNDDEDGLPVPSAGVLQLQPLMAHSSLGAVPAAGGVAGVKPGGAGKPPTGPKGEAGGTAAARGGSSSNGSSSSAASNARRHTVSTTEAGGSSSSPGGCTPAPSSNGGNTARTQGMAWGWSLQGLQLLPHSPLPHPTSSIRALAQAAAAAVAAFSGTFGTLDRGVSGIPREVATSPAAAAAAAAGGSAAPVPAAAAAGVVAPPTPSMGELLSMQSAPALRQGASGRSSGGGGKPPLPRH